MAEEKKHGSALLDYSEPGVTPPVIAPGYDFGRVTDKIAAPVLTSRMPWSWVFGALVAFGVMNVLMGAVTWLFLKGWWKGSRPVGVRSG